MRTKRNELFANAVKVAGIDIEKDFFALSSDDVRKVEEIRKAFRYSGKNYLGRSRVRQFWYACQKGAGI